MNLEEALNASARAEANAQIDGVRVKAWRVRGGKTPPGTLVMSSHTDRNGVDHLIVRSKETADPKHIRHDHWTPAE
jgi:hypothetical protein